VSLSQALVKVASPGVPDYYQGTELWDFSLVDPDNRRPVEYGVRSRFLAELEKRAPKSAELLANLSDGRAKLHVIRQGLAVRKAHPELFHGGEYHALHADGGFEENVIAFSLGGRVIAIAPRLFARRLGPDALAPIGDFWGEARVALPEGEFEDVLTGASHRGGARPMAELLAEFPVALLLRR
jgi:(1->4)-alpha-D-glucan 1-alpha-D-glucosylmutase